jgi:hypothetical protein
MIRAAAMLVLAGALSAEVKTSLLERSEGFFPYYWDESAGKLWIEIASERWNQEFLYVAGLSTGVGSNDLGLDRGRSTESMIVRWERFGPKAMLVHRNYGYRASSANAAERLAVEEAFAQSVIFGGGDREI